MLLIYLKIAATNETRDAESPESLWSRLCYDMDFRGEYPKTRTEVLILKQDALNAGLPPDIWSKEHELTDPANGQKYKSRVDYKYAVSSRAALDICPLWFKSADGHDVDLPLAMMSYVEVPASAEIGVVWHATNLTKSGYKSIMIVGLDRQF